MKELLTVVVPIYNREAFLKETLASMLSLKGHGIVLMLVDNGSSDASLSICREFALKNNSDDFKIRVEVEHTPGACAARNKGLELCTTPYVYFFDSDDIITPNFAPYVEHLLSENLETDVYYLPIRIYQNGNEKVKVFVKQCSAKAQILTGMISTPSILAKTEFIKRIGGWNETLNIWQDWELGIRVVENAKHIEWITNEVFQQIHQHSNSISGNNFSSKASEIVNTMQTAVTQHKRWEEAIWMRAVIVEEHMRREGGKEAAALLKEFQIKLKGQMHRCNGWKASILRLYMRLGLRGAWHIALKLA